MQNSRRIFVFGLVVALAGLSACHASADGTYKVRFVSQTDAKKVLELKLQDPGILARVHMAVFSGRIKGSYVLKDGETAAEGRVTQDEKGYTLVSTDGKKQRLNTDQEGTVKDETGAIWKMDNPTTTAELRKW